VKQRDKQTDTKDERDEEEKKKERRGTQKRRFLYVIVCRRRSSNVIVRIHERGREKERDRELRKCEMHYTDNEH